MDCMRRARFYAPWFDCRHMPMLHRQMTRSAAIDRIHMLNSSDNCSTSGKTAAPHCHCCWGGRRDRRWCSCGRHCSHYCYYLYCCCCHCCWHCSSSCWTLTLSRWPAYDNRPCRRDLCRSVSRRAISFYWHSLAACSMALHGDISHSVFIDWMKEIKIMDETRRQLFFFPLRFLLASSCSLSHALFRLSPRLVKIKHDRRRWIPFSHTHRKKTMTTMWGGKVSQFSSFVALSCEPRAIFFPFSIFTGRNFLLLSLWISCTHSRVRHEEWKCSQKK